MNDPNPELAHFFKALADGTRLKIVGLLARESLTGEQLAVMLALKPATVSHHLAKLAEAGLVEAEGQRGREKPYRLRLDAVHGLAHRLLAQETLPQTVAGVDVEAFDRKVIRDFSRRDGSLKEIPAQQKKLQAVLRHIARQFEAGKVYNEKHVNFVLARFHPDSASLRRALVSYRLLARDVDGRKYWRPEAEAVQTQAVTVEKHEVTMSQADGIAEAVNQEELEAFFRTLVDTERLAIAGRLARGHCTTEQLVAELGQKPAAVARHLATLMGAGLVKAEPRPTGARYGLLWQAPRALAARLSARPPAPELPATLEAYDQQVLKNYLAADGRFRELPLQEKKMQAVLRYVVREFEAGRQYTEKQVNEALARFHNDTSGLRRQLVDAGYLRRTTNGSRDWLSEATPAP
jgi:predicted transcriptional regulator